MSEETHTYAPNLAEAPMPDARTLRRRNSICYQFWRFLVIDFKMMKVIYKKH